jgi:hypothetical protein
MATFLTSVGVEQSKSAYPTLSKFLPEVVIAHESLQNFIGNMNSHVQGLLNLHDDDLFLGFRIHFRDKERKSQKNLDAFALTHDHNDIAPDGDSQFYVEEAVRLDEMLEALNREIRELTKEKEVWDMEISRVQNLLKENIEKKAKKSLENITSKVENPPEVLDKAKKVRPPRIPIQVPQVSPIQLQIESLEKELAKQKSMKSTEYLRRLKITDLLKDCLYTSKKFVDNKKFEEMETKVNSLIN